MLLAGLAVETLTKGVVLGRNQEYIKSQNLLRESTHHNLKDLYRTAGLTDIPISLHNRRPCTLQPP
jgi:hypothetical protein